MARSSFGSNRAKTWTVTQKPRPMPRIVRLGRPANDNHHRHGLLRGLLMVGLVAALLALVVSGVRLI
ncbi:MAG: hypothetical protein PSV46_24050 [Reyranella sp.]|nr:hypothetical protein [Reyranella sp.]